MKTEFRRDTRHQYLVVHPEESDVFGYRAKMIWNNRIEGFAECFSEEFNGQNLFYYDIPAGYTALSAYLETSPVSEGLYRRILSGLSDAMMKCQEYLLKTDEILLDAETVFLQPDSGKVLFLYYPLSDMSLSEKCVGFSETLLHRMNHEDPGAVEIGYAFYRVCVNENITAEMLREMARKPVSQAEPRSSPAGGPGRNVSPNAGPGCPPNANAAPYAPLRAPDYPPNAAVGPDAADYSFLYEEPEDGFGKKHKKKREGGLFGRKKACGEKEKKEKKTKDRKAARAEKAEKRRERKKRKNAEPDYFDDLPVNAFGQEEAGFAAGGYTESPPIYREMYPGGGMAGGGYAEPSGMSGSSGYAGPSGMPGSGGYAGPSGMPGSSGYAGAPGMPGSSGYAGPSGMSGSSGYAGAPGMPGSSGYAKTPGMPAGSGNGYPGSSTPAGPHMGQNPPPPDTLETVVLSMPGMKKSVRARLTPEDGSAAETIELTADSYTVGKSVAGADIRIESAAVSRIQARLTWVEDTYGLSDLDSRNGTYLNKIPIRPGEIVRLKDGDAVRFADRTYVFRRGGAAM